MVLLLGSCKVMQPYRQPEITPEDALYRDMKTGDTSNIADIPWRSLFTDQHLILLIEEALGNNPDMQIAIARMRKAEATLAQSNAAFFPSLNLDANAIIQQYGSSSKSEDYKISAGLSWEADIWGKLRNTKRAGLALFLKSEAYKRAVQTQLVADVAHTYYTLLALDAQLEVTEKAVESRIATVEAIRLMKESDMVTGADLVQSQANLYSAKILVPDIKQSIYEQENSMSLLLGRYPGPVARGTLVIQQFSIDIQTGVPAQLLANRPDVQEAEYQLRYGYEMTNAARKYFYPSLTVSASGGYSVTDMARMFEPASLFWNLIGGLTQPLFSRGINRQRLKSAEADQEEYLASYKQTLLRAGQEVANAMYEYKSASEKINLRTSQIEYLEKSVDFTMELLKFTSSTTYTDVLLAEMNLLSAQLSVINDKLQQLQSIVTLYRSLGGGWKK
jgi:NodT family efflux transporter outer membrane factor (OMF) lipoprotein